MRGRGGFTLAEMTIVLAVTSVLVPTVHAFSLQVGDAAAVSRWHLEAARGLRDLAEDLRLDARAGEPVAGPEVGFRLPGCDVRYRVTAEATLVREAGRACGGSRGVARSIERVRGVEGGVEVVFARPLRPGRVERATAFVPVEGR